MRRYMTITFIILSVLLVSYAYADELLICGNEVVKADATIYKYALTNVQTEPYYNDLELDIGISSVAISPKGEVAIISKGSNANCDFIISVYSSDGIFSYGHKINLKYHKGKMQLFYSEEGNLCFRCCYVNRLDDGTWYPEAIIVFGPEGICDCYEIFNQHAFMLDGMTKIDRTKTYISPQSSYRIEQLDSAYLSIRNTRNNDVIEIYNKVQENSLFERELQNNKTILIIVECIVAAFVLLVVGKK